MGRERERREKQRLAYLLLMSTSWDNYHGVGHYMLDRITITLLTECYWDRPALCRWRVDAMKVEACFKSKPEVLQGHIGSVAACSSFQRKVGVLDFAEQTGAVRGQQARYPKPCSHAHLPMPCPKQSPHQRPRCCCYC